MKQIIHQQSRHRSLFLYKFLQSPRNIGSIVPSSSFLAQKIMEPINWDEIDTIVELGAGVGAFTDYIDRHKKASTQAVIVEKDEEMLEILKTTYSSFHFASEAKKLDIILEQLGISEVDCIISGLPFANFSPEYREIIIQTVFRSLKQGGLFIAFQYSLQMKAMLKQCFSEVGVHFVPFNIPPAFVYRCKK